MIECTEILVFIVAIIVIIFIKLLDKNPLPIFNVYERPNGMFWIKVAFMFTILKLRQTIQRLKKNDQSELDQLKQLEKPQKLSPLAADEKAVDAVYFNGANKNGDHLVVGTARRKNKLLDGFLYIKLNGTKFGILETPKLPGTALIQTDNEIDKYSAEGLTITPIEPMKKWKIQYDGMMKQYTNRKQLFKVKIEVDWVSELPHFNFDSDMDPLTMAKSTAYEKWSRGYFDTLKKMHQTHYEQPGDLSGTVTINDEVFKIQMNAVRDHTIGNHRDWKSFHRYGIHFLSAENGDRFQVGMVCMPITFSRLTIGYVYCAEDKKIYPVTDCDLQLYQHGENGEAPTDYAFTFVAGNRTYTMQVNVIDSPHFYISKDWECKVVERLCKFNINGVNGWGAAEWTYRNLDGKKVPDYLEV